MTDDLFPETTGAEEAPREWRGKLRGKWEFPLVTVRILPEWSAADGWVCGWFAHVGGALDEWHPGNPDAWRRIGSYPWHRLDQMPTSKTFAVAAGQAARGVRLVIEQMLGYVEPDIAADARDVSNQIEAQARRWLMGQDAR